MGHPKPEELSHEVQSERQMQLVYARKTQERQIFMEDLYNYRKRKDKALIKEIKDSMGTMWYQALSVPQISALDSLEFSIYQDLLEERPSRTKGVMRALGIIPRPHVDDLMHCIYIGRNDPKEMLAQLFLIRYNHSIDLKRSKYDLNARLLLSGIFYLGLPHLLKMLREQFQPDQLEVPPKLPKKPKRGPPLASPYLQKMIAICYEPKKWVRKPPPPLPNLDALNEPLEETPPVPKLPPPPPPPPPPKKKLPRAFCDKITGVKTVEPYSSVTALAKRPVSQSPSQAVKRIRRSKYITAEKKVFGIGNTRELLKGRRRKPKAPSTGIWNAQYTICGVARVRGKVVFILGRVSILSVTGNIIHGGHALVNGEHINVNRGIRGKPPPPKPDRCDCLKKWTGPALKFLKESKCYCGHHYDYYNEGVFPPEELPFIEKPTRHGPLQINYNNIYEIDPKRLHVGKEFKRIWDTESTLLVEDPTKKKPQQKKKKRSSKTCLGVKPKPLDYLRCALHRLRHLNIAARLPDIHLVPELVTWMHRRLYGPYTYKQNKDMLSKSNVHWTLFTRFAGKSIPHVAVPKIAEFNETTTWQHKQKLNDKFRKFINNYRLEMFRAHAEFSNMMWPSMFQAQMPDKKFREIYFSYLFGTIENLTLMHPYNPIDTEFHYAKCIKNPYHCPPAGIEKVES